MKLMAKENTDTAIELANLDDDNRNHTVNIEKSIKTSSVLDVIENDQSHTQLSESEKDSNQTNGIKIICNSLIKSTNENSTENLSPIEKKCDSKLSIEKTEDTNGEIRCNGLSDETDENTVSSIKSEGVLLDKKCEFKVRIIPLERLLEPTILEKAKNRKNGLEINSSSELSISDNKISKQTKSVSRLRKNRNSTLITVISDSEEELPLIESAIIKEDELLNECSAALNQSKEIHINKRKKRFLSTSSCSKDPSIVTLKKDTQRCVVRIKRISFPSLDSNFKESIKTRNMNKIKLFQDKMNGAELPSTSTGRRNCLSSDDASDDSEQKETNADRISDGVSSENMNIKTNEDEGEDSDNSSSSEILANNRKRRGLQQRNKKSYASDSDFEPEISKEKNKRRRIKHNSSDDDSDKKSGDEYNKKNKRKHIRKIMKTSDLDISTKTATKEEELRRKRIQERQKLYNQIYDKSDNIELNELVLDFNSETKETLLEVDKGLLKKLKPHQVAGVKFMWDACFETIKDAQEKPGSGCILAHCMGLGKTLQVVTLCHTLLTHSRKTNVERVLIITPLSTLNNWAREFKYWISFARKKNIEIYDMSKYKDKLTRIFKLNEWYEEGGVCILGYDMYRILSNEKAKGLRKKQRETLQRALVDAGPDLVVCDEGHLLKNEKTSISKAVTRMRTMRRIVLTGTPLQNNLKEYYCMIQFIKPNLLGTYKEYLNRFVNPISNGQYTDSTDRDIRLMKHRSHILHKLLEGCIQRRDYSVLAPYLPPKHEYVVYTTLSLVQQQLYEHYMTEQRDLTSNVDFGGKGARLFQDFQELRRIWTHPMNMRINSDSVIRKKVLNNDNDSMDDFICDNDDEEEDIASSSDSTLHSSKSFGSANGGVNSSTRKVKTRSYRKNTVGVDHDKESDVEDVESVPTEEDPSEWWRRFVADKELNILNHSPKLVILMRLLEQCEAIGDKVLVFSQSLQSLDTIEHFLALIDSKTRGYEYEGDVGDLKGFWMVGADYFRLDGSCTVEQRETMCKKFNDTNNLRARLFLISTRAGGLGINLVSANRVVIFDVSWNPSHDTQSIFRVYRFGQEKPCYIYRLLAMGTMEQKLYERQVAKQATAKRVIDEQQISRHYNQSDLQELYTYELMPIVEREIPILPRDRLFAELLSEHEKLLFKYHEHDSLLENEESENLSEAERKAAWAEYEAEKTRTVQTTQYIAYDRNTFGAMTYGNQSGNVTSNKIFGFRTDVLLQLLNMKVAKDHPELSQTQIIQLVPSYLQTLYTQMNSGDPTMYKDLYNLHATLTHPSGMYMNPLLYVNQNPGAAGYYQNNTQSMTGVNGLGNIPQPMIPPGATMPTLMATIGNAPDQGTIAGPVSTSAPGFDPNHVYEID